MSKKKSIFASGANMARNSGMVIVLWLAAFLMMSIGLYYFCEDYMTSVNGYAMLPTRHHFPAIIWAGALLPQIGQIVFAYLAADDSSKWWAWLVVGCFFVVDSGTDIQFKTMPGVEWSLPTTIAEVFIMYTIGSEVFTALGAGLCLELLPDMKRAVVALKGRWREASVHRSEAWGIHARSESPRGRSRPSSGTHRPSRETQRPSSGMRRPPVGEPRSGSMSRGEVRW